MIRTQKRQPLAFLQWIFTLNYVCPSLSLCALFRVIAFLFGMLGLLASLTFFVQFMSADTNAAVHSVYEVFAFVRAIHLNITLWQSRSKINGIFLKLTQIYDKCELFIFCFQYYFIIFRGSMEMY